MYRLGILFCLALVTVGCDSPDSTCERAQARLAECNERARADYPQPNAVNSYVELPIALSSCESVSNQCLASCVVDSQCEVINFDVFGQGHTDPDKKTPPGAGQFSLCVDYCYALAHPNR
ncbi:MAG TPA: hypothetical protein VER96_12175 [Polyangiaceae bacterium]|nr:hypothetical protein [Polyangiaceae bacterium]